MPPKPAHSDQPPVTLDPWEVFGPEVMVQAPYRIIYADPPWETFNRRGPLGGTHYPLMRNTDIVSLPVRQLADRDSLLVLWITWPNLDWMTRLVDAWGFKYVTGLPWVKQTAAGQPWLGMGHWLRECSELLVIARRGNVSPPKPPRPGIFFAPRGAVSRKPDEVATWVESLAPGPYIELFARRPRPGWVVWGNEI